MTDPMLEHKRQALRQFYFLPLFYMIPREHLAPRKLDGFPRNPFVAVSSPKWRRLYSTAGWQLEVAEIWAYMMWPHLELRGRLSHYTIDDPFVRLMYSLPMWAMLLALTGATTDLFATFPDDEPIRYLTAAEAEHNCKLCAKLFWQHPYLKARQAWEIIQEHRAHDDFSKRRTAVYIDFLRKYYHTRTQYKSVALQDADGEHEYIPDNSQDINNVIGNDWVEKFYGWLGNWKDIEICKLLFLGLTQKEIAARLGYKSHSGVNKRIAKIRDILSVFVEWQIDLEDAPPPKPAPSTVRYDVIEFEYKRK
jgi:hypothetical protein